MQEPLPVRAGDPETNQRIVSVLPTDSVLILRLRVLEEPMGPGTPCSLSQNQPCCLVPHCLSGPACASLPRPEWKGTLAQREALAF